MSAAAEDSSRGNAAADPTGVDPEVEDRRQEEDRRQDPPESLASDKAGEKGHGESDEHKSLASQDLSNVLNGRTFFAATSENEGGGGKRADTLRGEPPRSDTLRGEPTIQWRDEPRTEFELEEDISSPVLWRKEVPPLPPRARGCM